MEARDIRFATLGADWFNGLHDDFMQSSPEHTIQAQRLINEGLDRNTPPISYASQHAYDKAVASTKEFLTRVRETFGDAQKNSEFSLLEPIRPIEVDILISVPEITNRYIKPALLSDAGCDAFAEVAKLSDTEKETLKSDVALAREEWRDYVREQTLQEPTQDKFSLSRFLGLVLFMGGERDLRKSLMAACDTLTRDSKFLQEHPEYQNAKKAYQLATHASLQDVVEQYPSVIIEMAKNVGLGEDEQVMNAVRGVINKGLERQESYGKKEMARDMQTVNVFVEMALMAVRSGLRTQGEWTEWLNIENPPTREKTAWRDRVSSDERAVDLTLSPKTLFAHWPDESQVRALAQNDNVVNLSVPQKIRQVAPEVGARPVKHPFARQTMGVALPRSFQLAEAAKSRLEAHGQWEVAMSHLSGGKKKG